MSKNDICRLCLERLPINRRRFIFAKTFQLAPQIIEVTGIIPKENYSFSSYTCYGCFAKLNKLNKIDFDLKNKVNSLHGLREEKNNIVSEFHKKVNSICVSATTVQLETTSPRQQIKTVSQDVHSIASTPQKSLKRLIAHTPTPRKVKSKRTTPLSPAKLFPTSRKRLSEHQLSPDKVKVSFRGIKDRKIRTRLIKDSSWKSILKSIVRGDKLKTLSKKIYDIPSLKGELQKCLLKDLSLECTSICRVSKPSVLRTKSDVEFNLGTFANELRSEAPLLYSIIQTVIKHPSDNKLAITAAVMLRNRNQHMSAIHQIIGQLLDHGGATDETIRLLSSMGLSVGPQSVSVRRGQLVAKQEKKMSEMFTDRGKQCRVDWKIKKCKSTMSVFPDRDVPSTSLSICYSPQHLEHSSNTVEPGRPGMTYFIKDTEFNAYSQPKCTTHTVNSEHYTEHSRVSGLPKLVIQTKAGRIELPEVPNLPSTSGLCRTDHAYSVADTERTKKILKNFIFQNQHAIENVIPSYEIIGDNLDLSIAPSSMTKEKQRRSFHWFLNVAVRKRVLSDLPNDIPKADILQVPNSEFLPSISDCHDLDTSLTYHISKILCKYVKCLQPFEKCLPEYIDHPFIKELSMKSEYRIMDLLDKSENKSDEMISILEHIHKKYIPHTDENPPGVIDKVVFGGDVLTNERAYAAQLAMMNNESDYFRLAGVIHRPEGLHRMMNFLLIIYQQLYKTTSAADQGTLFQLRNVLQRPDVSGPEGVTEKFRSHMTFVQDCLDAFILGACMDLLGIDNLDARPSRTKLPEFINLRPQQEQYEWIHDLSQQLLDVYVKVRNDNFSNITAATEEMDTKEKLMTEMFDNTSHQYICTCQKKYKTKGHFKRHLQKEHNWLFVVPVDSSDASSSSKYDHIATYRASFMKMALLLRDTEDAFRMGDGNRIFRNAKFEMLCADVGHHTKYKLWLWRLQAYENSLLTPCQAFEYKWNCMSNINGGRGSNIPNDNLVEICVHKIKEKLREQGSNITYESAKKIALCLQMQEDIRDNFKVQLIERKGKKRPTVEKKNDLDVIIKELKAVEIFKYIPGREFNTFKQFEDIFQRIKVVDLQKWITTQKQRTSYEVF